MTDALRRTDSPFRVHSSTETFTRIMWLLKMKKEKYEYLCLTMNEMERVDFFFFPAALTVVPSAGFILMCYFVYVNFSIVTT